MLFQSILARLLLVLSILTTRPRNAKTGEKRVIANLVMGAASSMEMMREES